MSSSLTQTYNCICPRCRTAHKKRMFLFETSTDQTLRIYCKDCKNYVNSRSAGLIDDGGGYSISAPMGKHAPAQ